MEISVGPIKRAVYLQDAAGKSPSLRTRQRTGSPISCSAAADINPSALGSSGPASPGSKNFGGGGV